MNMLEKVLVDNRGPGMYLQSVQEAPNSIQETAERIGLQFMYLDGELVTSADDCFKQIRNAIQCPYMGNNWNALLDCMRGFEWFPKSKGFVLLYSNIHVFFESDPSSFKLLIDTLQDAVEHWRNQPESDPRLYILLQGIIPSQELLHIVLHNLS